jgi:membrane-associated phospholipid phosphatase
MAVFTVAKPWLLVSRLGAPVTLTVLIAIVAARLLSRRQHRAALACLVIAGGGGMLNRLLKALVHRPRPPGAELILNGFSWSFPSGHAMDSLIVYGVICFGALPYYSAPALVRRTIIALAAVIIVLVGVSRIALGVHYPGDVAGGWAIGVMWLVLGLRVWRRLDPTAPRGIATPEGRVPAPAP